MSVNVMRIKATSHLVTLNHFDPDLGILKRQQALELEMKIIQFRAPSKAARQMLRALQPLSD
jgi:hypothetical protein